MEGPVNVKTLADPVKRSAVLPIANKATICELVSHAHLQISWCTVHCVITSSYLDDGRLLTAAHFSSLFQNILMFTCNIVL